MCSDVAYSIKYLGINLTKVYKMSTQTTIKFYLENLKKRESSPVLSAADSG